MDTVLMELVLWKNILPMIQMNIIHRCKWDYQHMAPFGVSAKSHARPAVANGHGEMSNINL